MNKSKISILLSWTAVLLWLALIFYLLSQPAAQSDDLSRKVTKVIIEKVGAVVPLDNETSTTVDLVARFNHMVKKCGHFGLYLVLGILVTNALVISGVIGFKGFLFSLIFCILYAISDEVHQLFVSGRSGQVTDVLIDSLGAFVGIGMYLGFDRIKKKVRIGKLGI